MVSRDNYINNEEKWLEQNKKELQLIDRYIESLKNEIKHYTGGKNES